MRTYKFNEASNDLLRHAAEIWYRVILTPAFLFLAMIFFAIFWSGVALEIKFGPGDVFGMSYFEATLLLAMIPTGAIIAGYFLTITALIVLSFLFLLLEVTMLSYRLHEKMTLTCVLLILPLSWTKWQEKQKRTFHQ
ncbi:MAG: hypothetical protein O2877_02560 [bacterium]|nr:hypothetical protein [bacterium]